MVKRDIILAVSKELDEKQSAMPKEKKSKKWKREQCSGQSIFSTAQQCYITALEGEVKEQRLRVLLYQNIISTASEQLGEDILKKIGTQRSGP